jgi:hypothetical protein
MIIATEILSKGGLSHVTPSTWLNLQQCAWQVLLARHFHYKPLLPVHPNATLGNILHTVLEKITKGELRTREEFNQWWDEKVKKAEQDLTHKGWGQFVPLKENARHFGLKKVQARNRLLPFQGSQSHTTGTFSKVAEQKLVTADGLLAGQLDCIIWRNGQAEVRDYKTGVITMDSEGEETAPLVKQEYELQMKLYACLFQERYGNYPARLVLEDLNGVEHEVKFTPEECSILLQGVKSLLSEINQKIAENECEDLAILGNYCTFCNYRPACNKYLNLLETVPTLPDKGWHDLSGELISIEENGIYGLGLNILRTGEVIKISGFDVDKRERLTGLLNHQIAIFNVKLTGAQKFTGTKFTEIYAI